MDTQQRGHVSLPQVEIKATFAEVISYRGKYLRVGS
jgi:hypothetical protein